MYKRQILKKLWNPERELAVVTKLDVFDDLIAFQSTLGINTENEQTLTIEARDQFEENQSAYGDHMQDEWKEQYYGTKSEENGIRDLFSTLL